MIEKAKETALFLLRQDGHTDSATEAAIDSAIESTIKLFPVDPVILKRHIEADFKIWVEDFRIIEKDEAKRPWLANKRAKIEWSFWSRYKWLLEEKMNFPSKTIDSINRLTDRSLDAVFDPAVKGKIDKRGMVVGQVQSGKTANYTGLICKAADAGFRIIIVMAGIHKNLRSQTQLRIDEGFLGFDTQYQRAFDQNNKWIGVGELRQNRNIVAHSLTSSMDNGDFNAGAANALGLNFQTNEPIIAVIKKNSSVLTRLHQWLASNAVEDQDGNRKVQNKSLLLIDDEADNASINTKRDELNPTRINGLIRDILRLFDKSGYVGYTATPFANIFIPLNEDNLFPRDFIVNIPAPTNYIGPQKIFGFEPLEDDDDPTDTLPVVHRIDDYIDFVPNRHKKDDQLPVEVPQSLKTAIKCFILTCSIRRVRGQITSHNTMLIHVSRFIRWQSHIKELVQEVFDFYRRGIEHQIPFVVEELRKAYEEDTSVYRSYRTTTTIILESELKEIDPAVRQHDWEDVRRDLHEAAARIEVKEIHGGAADALNYYDHKEGLSVIAVGGNKLSRGLTLEGLSVSYYLRASRMYDTLMQMGRWFGYRPGYVDLCRLFTSRELNEWFCHITLASEDLRVEFDYMSDIAGSTPEEYALKVRTHPGVLQISATNKIRSAVNVNISWSGALVETYKLSKDPDYISTNFKAVEDLVHNIMPTQEIKGHYYLWRDISSETALDFIKQFQAPANLSSNPSFLTQFIELKIKNNELTDWNIALMSKAAGEKRNVKGLSIGMFLRKEDKKQSDKDIYYMPKSHIISPRHEFIDLSKEQYDEAYRRTRVQRAEKGLHGEPLYPNGKIVRNEFRNPQTPLLLIYLFDPIGADLETIDTPVVGFAISFPGSRNIDNVQFAVHEQLLPKFDIEHEFEDYDPNED